MRKTIIDAHEARTDAELDALAGKGRDLRFNVSEADCDRVADLALRLTREDARRAMLPMSGPNARPYVDRTANERAALRAAVMQVLKALVLLGWIEPPGL
jgi:hypothetical protein